MVALPRDPANIGRQYGRLTVEAFAPPGYRGARMCRVCADRHNDNRRQNRKKDGETRIVDAMRVVLEYETEWFATGVVVKDERYLIAKELVERRAI